MTKFTKGEWLVSDNKINSPVRHIVKMPSSKPTKYNGTMYACIGGFKCGTQTEEAEANAHLIAAAPDMYKMLLECFHSSNKGAWKDSLGELLAKARGE
ncbi:MAG: hypothetical protein MJK15_03950 [Colwellia sp.]|nr:hypothetical protein [Colwellia sp.]